MKAELFRMVSDEHICPFGMKSKHLLEKQGYEVIDHKLRSREETDQFKEAFQVETTPQTFIGTTRIGGYDDLSRYFGHKSMKQEGTTYQPVIAIFLSTFFMSLAVVWSTFGLIDLYQVFYHFIALSMCVLAILKLRDLFSFSNQFITYDILAKRKIAYSYIYPFAEFAVGLGMLAGVLMLPVSFVAIFIGSIGAISVVKAVYIEKRDIKCACVGGDSNVPLGAVSLTENLMMVLMGIIMLFKY